MVHYKYLLVVILFTSCLSNVTFSQKYLSSENEGKKLLNIAKEIIDSSDYCALITLDNDGTPKARPMDPFKPDHNFIIRLGTNSNSRKVKQIKKDPRVTLYYLSKDATSYVTVNGIARLVNDKDAKQKWWKEQWKDFYPDKEKEYLIIEVTPKQIELISETKGIFGNKKTWKAPVIKFNYK